jgi:hypothetical protein
MKKIVLLGAIALLPVFLNAKIITAVGTFIGEDCGDMCYMTFKTKNGEISPIGSLDGFPKIKVGKNYTIVYEEKMEYIEQAGAKIKVQILKSVK